MENIISIFSNLALMTVSASLVFSILSVFKLLRMEIGSSKKLLKLGFIFDNLVLLLEVIIIFFKFRVRDFSIIGINFFIAFISFYNAKDKLKILIVR